MQIKSSFFWSFIDQIFNFFFNFIFGVLLARILTPNDFGIFSLGIIALSISEVFVNSGLTSALIRKGEKASPLDFSSVFYFNIFISILLSIILFQFSSKISKYFNEPVLTNLFKVISFSIIIESLAIIQMVKLTIKLDFKRQAKITSISSLFSGLCGIILAFSGFGIWSLVFQKILKQLLFTFLIWKTSKWRPLLSFSRNSIVELMSFGGNLFLSSLVNIFSANIFSFFVGKNFSLNLLGSFNKAQELVQIPSKTFSNVVERVTFPLLSNILNSDNEFVHELKLIIKRTMFLTFVSLSSLIVIAKPLVYILLGDQWDSVIPFLKLFCFVNLLYPLHSINLTVLKVLGLSNLFLKLELFKVLLVIKSLFFGFYFGLNAMLFSMMFNSIVNLFINTYWNKKHIGYSLYDQICDISPSLLGSGIVGGLVYTIGLFLNISYLYLLFFQGFLLIILFIAYFELSRNSDFFYFKNNLKSFLLNYSNKHKIR
jgi:teichuronic acid exporter